MKSQFAKAKSRILTLMGIKSAWMNNFRMKKIIPLLGVMALIILTKTACTKFPGGIPPPTNFTCDITEFYLDQSLTNGTGAFNYITIFTEIIMPEARGDFFGKAQNIQYNAFDQPVMASGIADSLYFFLYDSLNRLSDFKMLDPQEFAESLFLYKFIYKPGSILPDSLYFQLLEKGQQVGPYAPKQAYQYDAFLRLIRVTSLPSGIYHRLVYGAGGDLQTVYEGKNNNSLSEKPILLFQSYDHMGNCMRTNPVWTILSGMYSINNPTKVTHNVYNPDGTISFSEQLSLSYKYGGTFKNLPASFYNQPLPGTIPEGSIVYSCSSILPFQ